MSVKKRLNNVMLSLFLIFSACANAQQEKGDSYWIVESQHTDCNVYMMIFYSGEHSFRIAQSGTCQSLSISEFLKDYEGLLIANKKNIGLPVGNVMIFDCYNNIDLKNKSNINRIIEVTKKHLGVKTHVKKQVNELLELEITES